MTSPNYYNCLTTREAVTFFCLATKQNHPSKRYYRQHIIVNLSK